jgi:hypothetical protein
MMSRLLGVFGYIVLADRMVDFLQIFRRLHPRLSVKFSMVSIKKE